VAGHRTHIQNLTVFDSRSVLENVLAGAHPATRGGFFKE
jgi:ABC-type branched-subunit amino acid transport system ATPase component